MLPPSIWSRSLNQGNQWSKGQVTLAAAIISRNFQIVFEGVRGIGDLGDIAIDDVKLSQGSCSNGVAGASPGRFS
ncbi:hypothetical protein DPMN_011686 [Dreissena polymorpha]|uniref:MAM domain-containing protein n=1 Tax=Dreissena polymorpha TaxID=45954 RepID=A0A9D4S250_DREPO|nr:hypothetical protein DPMN_011686 [Dreissena polymorpha]